MVAKPLPAPMPGVKAPMIKNELQRLASERPGDVTAIAYALNMITGTATSAELGAVIEQMVADELLLKAPNAAVWVIHHDPAISHRITGARVLLQIESDPSLLSRRPLVGADGLAFNSSRYLLSDTALGLSAYLEPLFLSRAPWVWGFSAGRPGAIIAPTPSASLSSAAGRRQPSSSSSSHPPAGPASRRLSSHHRRASTPPSGGGSSVSTCSSPRLPTPADTSPPTVPTTS
jgi:hypothetical protein